MSRWLFQLEQFLGFAVLADLEIFIGLTVILGGAAAYLSGRAAANTWRPALVLIPYVALLTAAVRFIHFALFDAVLLSPFLYLRDFIVLLVLAGLGFRITRATQMARQYHWLFRRAGPFGWRPRNPGSPG